MTDMATDTQPSETERLLAMTPDQHMREAATILAHPRSNQVGHLRALAHLAMAQVKQARTEGAPA